MTFNVSNNAIERIKQISKKENQKYFRISVDGGGCQGFSYKFNFDKKINKEDKVFVFDDIQILIDPTSLDFLNGSELDFVNGLK